MKSALFIGVLATVGIAANASAIDTFSPNFVNCRGKNIEATYTTSNYARSPVMSVNRGANYYTAYGDDVFVSESVLGKLVTIQTEAIPDLYSITETLIVPEIRMRAADGEVVFHSYLIQTKSHTTIGGPDLVLDRPHSENAVVKVKCEASIVQF